MIVWTDSVRSREHELRLEASPVSGAGNSIRVVLSARDEEALEGTFELPFGPSEVTAGYATAKGLTEQHVSRSHQELPPDPLRELGRQLFDCVFQGQGRALLDRCRARADRAETGLRVRIVPRAEDGRDARWLPWEFLYDSRRRDFLALSMLSRVVRDIDEPPADVISLVTPPVRALVVGADCTGQFEVAEEIKKLREIARRNRGRLQLTVLPSATADEFLGAVRAGGHHVLHFLGTGVPPEIGTGRPVRPGLLLMPKNRQPLTGGRYLAEQVVTADDLRGALADGADFRFVVLDACETDEVAARAAGGLQGAVGVRGSITVAACRVFAFEVYRAVCRGEPLDAALTYARQQIDHRLTGSREWGLLTFYLQTPDGELARWERPDFWPGQKSSVGAALEAGRALAGEARKRAVRRAIDERNLRALLDLMDRADGDAPAVVREQLKEIQSRLKQP